VTAAVRRAGAAAAWRARALRASIVYFNVRFSAWWACRRHLREYRRLDEDELRRTRRSDTVFILGSGYSLNRLMPDEWSRIDSHDTIGFNWSVHEQFVRCDYHLVREICADIRDRAVWEPATREYFRLASGNPCYSQTIYLVQSGFRATSGNRAIGLRLLPRDRPVFLWRSLVNQRLPSGSLRRGLAHAYGTLSDCVNFAALMGWTTIVLVGVDLYDRRYFWLPADQPRSGDATVDEPHATAAGGMVEGMGTWREYLAQRDVRLFVYNPDSLLAGVLPVWNWT